MTIRYPATGWSQNTSNTNKDLLKIALSEARLNTLLICYTVYLI